MHILVTGGAGFMGSNFVHYILEKNQNYQVTVLDKLTYAGRMENLQDVLDKITFIRGDVCKKEDVEKAIKNCNIIVHFAAETHVDRSIFYGEDFVKTDVLGTFILLEAARKFEIDKFIYISTDEVYGSIESGSFTEEDKFNPSSSYSASKAGADLLCQAYFKTYGLNLNIVRPTNNYGPRQHPEKFIPKMIIYTMLNKPLPVYGKGENIRSWLYVEDFCKGVEIILSKGKKGEAYNLGGVEKKNIEVVKLILKELGKSEELIQFVKDRPAHDFRYSVSSEKIRKLGWEAEISFEKGLRKTIEWYKNNEWWWKPILKEEIDFHQKF